MQFTNCNLEMIQYLCSYNVYLEQCPRVQGGSISIFIPRPSLVISVRISWSRECSMQYLLTGAGR